MSTQDETKSRIAAGLKQYRLCRFWSLASLAQMLDVAPATIWRIEQGRVRPSDLTCQRILTRLPGFWEEVQ